MWHLIGRERSQISRTAGVRKVFLGQYQGGMQVKTAFGRFSVAVNEF